MQFSIRRPWPKPKTPTQEWVESIVVALFLALFIRTFFFQAFRIPSGSMEPTLQIGDRLLVNKLDYGPVFPFLHVRLPGFSHPQRGDVVVFKYPLDPHKDFIKRLIAFGGETLTIQFGEIYINGRAIDTPPMNKIFYYDKGGFLQRNNYVIEVPPGYYFVMGDNSANSQDSRYWGFVPEWMVVGKAAIIYWPLTRIRFIK